MVSSILMILTTILLLITVTCTPRILILFILKRDNRWASWIDCHLLSCRVHCCLRLIVGAIDAACRGDYNALGLRFEQWMEGRYVQFNTFGIATREGGVIIL